MDIRLLDFIYPIFIVVAVIGYVFFCYKYFWEYDVIDVPKYKMAIESTLFMIFNLVLHEIGHILTLKMYGRELGKIRFRMNFIFPTISVDTSDSYILPKFRRLYVYASGLIVNSFILMLLVVFFERYIYIGSFVVIAVLMNFLPIGVVRTDGYHIWINLILNRNDYKKRKSLWFLLSQLVFVLLIAIMGVFTLMRIIV